MFTIRAEIEERGIPGTKSYQVFSAIGYRVQPVNGPGVNGTEPVDRESRHVILLKDEHQELHDGLFLTVSPALDHYNVVYVMNEKGKTIDTIR